MSSQIENNEKGISYISLGGCEEIGMNVNLYQHKGKWIMIDCGSGFAEDNLPGVDMVVADIAFIEERKKDLLGIILTHAHEDHLGAIQHLWEKLGCPVYATNFTKNFLELKLAKSRKFNESNIDIKLVKTGKRFALGPFDIEMTCLTHSAPEMQALMIRTSAGNILHTGDWKFDPNPIVGETSDLDKLKSFGDEGVLTLTCDSTNVFNEGFSGSEKEVRDNLIEIIKECQNRVMVTTFASNLARLTSIMDAARLSGRKVLLSGTSLDRMIEAAKKSGYLQDIPDIIDEADFDSIDKNKILIIATGCQGEEKAATTKIAKDIHRSIKLAAGDNVIFSSKIIPGNEKPIFNVFNLFAKKKVNIITENDKLVHVSGHPSVGELKKMYELVRPQICLPVHGEPLHIQRHAKLAKELGIKYALEPENGMVCLLEKDNPHILQEKVQNGYFAVDGYELINTNSHIFQMRARMRDNGIIFANIILNKKYQFMDLILSFPGLFDIKHDSDSIHQTSMFVKEKLILKIKNNKRFTLREIEKYTHNTISNIFKYEKGKYPPIIVVAKII